MRKEDTLLSSIRELRAVANDERDLPRRLLGVILNATASVAATLTRPLAALGDLRIGAVVEGTPARLEQRFAGRSGVVVLTLERAASQPFDSDDARLLDIVGGEIVLRLDSEQIEREAQALRRQTELLRAVSSADAYSPRPFDVADRAARELLDTFGGADVAVHLVVEDRLELIARRAAGAEALEDAPEWLRSLPLDGETVAAMAARERQTVTRSVQEAPEPQRSSLRAMGIHHVVGVPLVPEDVVLGTVLVGHDRPEPWDAASLQRLEESAARLAADLAHAWLVEAERRRVVDLALINDLGALVAQHHDLRGVLSTAARALTGALDVPRVHVFLLNEARTHLEGVAATDAGVADLGIPLKASYAVDCAVRTHLPVVIEDAATDSRTNKALVAQVGTRSLVAVPLLAQGEVIGVIVLVETRRTRRFAESEVARVIAVANVIASAVTSARVFDDLRGSYEALAKAQSDLVKHERLAALGELSAVIAHEIRNPIAIIFNSLAALRRLAPPPPEVTLLVDIVSEETARLNRLVGDLLDFVRPYEAHPRFVALGAVVGGAIDAARRACERGVEIRTEVIGDSTELYVDGTMLQQALLNLVVNAIQATQSGRAVTVRAEVEPAEHGERLRCEVSDEGTGIDEATSARIFEPFYTTKATGTGLGLALVRRLAEALGGTVGAASRPTGGAVFTLTVPLSRSSTESHV